MRFIDKIIYRTRKFLDDITDRYDAFQSARKVLDRNFTELFYSTSDSLKDAVYSDRTAILESDLYSKFLNNQNTIYNKLWNVENSVTNLENILSGMETKSEKSHCASINYKPSRFKSAYISVFAGIGTTVKLYDILRAGDVITKENQDYSVKDINNIISIKNKYFWKDEPQLIKLIREECGLKVNGITELVKDAMRLKITNPDYNNIMRINYDSGIASDEMKVELVDAYIRSDKTLKEISLDFERKYGMHVSISTISRNVRKHLSFQGLDFNSRSEAKNYYSTDPNKFNYKIG